MTKNELASSLARKTGMTVAQATSAVDYVIEDIQVALAKGDNVEFRGFGAFRTKTRPARVGRNPQDPHTPIQIPSKVVVRFKTGALLNAALNPKP
jgi:nucleoid DNA-binding protein